jgi:hypothetical protein
MTSQNRFFRPHSPDWKFEDAPYGTNGYFGASASSSSIYDLPSPYVQLGTGRWAYKFTVSY